MLIYNPIETERKMRTGAEEEYFYRGQSGYFFILGPLENKNDLEILLSKEHVK
jgi:hypothetical protein